MNVLSFVLAGMNLLAPGRDHAELAGAVARVVEAEAPLFKGDDDRRRTAALVVAVAFRESSLRIDAVGDQGRSFCAFQIHQTSGGTRELLTDAGACSRKGFSMLRTSIRVCPDAPVAWYAAGPRGCESDTARRISSDRMHLAARLVRDVPERP